MATMCSRCGWCCHELFVILPDGTAKIGPQQCKFLKWDGIVAVCTIHGQSFDLTDDDGNIHHYEWQETPCGQYHSEDDIDFIAVGMKCLMGQEIMKRGGYKLYHDRQTSRRMVVEPNTRTSKAGH